MQLKDLKTSLFGFNKTDVCEYISQLNTVYEEKEEQLRQEQSAIVEALNQKNESLNNSVAALSQENTELVRERDALRKRIEVLTAETGRVKCQVEKMRETLTTAFESAANQLDLLENQVNDLLPEKTDEK